MGATDTKPQVYNYENNTVTYNSSIYTGYSDIPQLVENYPWIVWRDGSIMTEAYTTRLAVECSLWGVLGLILEVAVNLSGLSNLHNAQYPNAPGNDIGKF